LKKIKKSFYFKFSESCPFISFFVGKLIAANCLSDLLIKRFENGLRALNRGEKEVLFLYKRPFVDN